MRVVLACLLLALLPMAPARAALTQAEMNEVGMAPAPGARLAPDLAFRDEAGRPVTLGQVQAGRSAAVVLADFTCAVLCGTAIGIAGTALQASGLVPGKDAVLLVLGIDPRDGPAEAAAMRRADGDAVPAGIGAAFLTADGATLETVQEALAYRARHDAEADRYAHPLGVVILAPDGAVARVLPALDLDAGQLRLALVAAHGQIGTLGDRLRLLCYGLDPAHGIYNGAIARGLSIGTGLAMAGLLAFLVTLSRRRKSRP
jgi:protein SCO1/2